MIKIFFLNFLQQTGLKCFRFYSNEYQQIFMIRKTKYFHMKDLEVFFYSNLFEIGRILISK